MCESVCVVHMVQVYESTTVCIHIEVRGQPLMLLFTLNLLTGSLGFSICHLLGYQAGGPTGFQGFSCLCFHLCQLNSGVTDEHNNTSALREFWGFELMSSSLCGKHYPPTHFSSPLCFPIKNRATYCSELSEFSCIGLMPDGSQLPVTPAPEIVRPIMACVGPCTCVAYSHTNA